MTGPEDWVILVCPPGAETAPISHGDREFLPYREVHTDPHSRWLVVVPKEAAIHFCRTGGFRLLEAA